VEIVLQVRIDRVLGMEGCDLHIREREVLTADPVLHYCAQLDNDLCCLHGGYANTHLLDARVDFRCGTNTQIIDFRPDCLVARM
jgi:hypothetical protein